VYSNSGQELFSGIIKQVCDDHDPIIITRENNQAVVLLSLQDYEALNETAYLLQSPKNAKMLMESIEELTI
jgi:antitoxin YefM